MVEFYSTKIKTTVGGIQAPLRLTPIIQWGTCVCNKYLAEKCAMAKKRCINQYDRNYFPRGCTKIKKRSYKQM